MTANRRKRFFINKPLQFRYMLFVTVPLLLISLIALLGFYIGVWGKVLEAFSDEQTLNDLLTASRMAEYDQARHSTGQEGFSSLSVFKQTEKLGQRQREVFKNLLEETNRSLLWKFFLLLFFVAWGTIYISHKIAGPFYRFSKAMNEIENGNYRERIFLRKSDEGHPLAGEFNSALEATDRLLSDIKQISRESDGANALAKIKDKLSKIQTSADA